MSAWAAPSAAAPIDVVVTVPGSKSVTNRALVLAALATSPGSIRRPLRSRDTNLMRAALRTLGAGISDAEDSWSISTGIDRGATQDVAIDVGNAGTVLRFVPAVAALRPGRTSFDGDGAARRRPIGALLAALSALGATVTGDRLPFALSSGQIRGGGLVIDASASSQLVSALLLVGACLGAGLDLRHEGPAAVPNQPHLAMTVDMLRQRGVVLEASGERWSVAEGPIAGVEETVEPDLSSAAPFLAAAIVTGGRARVTGWPESTHQPGGLLPGLLRELGADVSRSGDDLVVTGGAVIPGIDVDLRDAGELTPVIAAIAAVASGRSRLRGIGYLRGHETDRLAALRTELSSLGTSVTETEDGLLIDPKPLHGGGFSSYDDHRMAMAGAVLGLVVPGIIVDDVATTAKTFPGFAHAWASMLTEGRATS
jgi:3-phosphoshikimate 1-carboxyvinyltransferase